MNYADTNGCEAISATQLNVEVTPGDTVSIDITSTADSICDGIQVIYTATPTHGGSTPNYQWMVDGINQGVNNAVFSYSPSDSDTVYCILTSSDTVCISNNPATSNELIMTVFPNLPISINISTLNNPVCEGDSATFITSSVNKGNLPVFQWFVNGIPVGTNDSTYSYVPSSGDLVFCFLTSSEQCTTGNPATSIPMVMSVWGSPEVDFSPCFDTITTTNARPILLRGGIPLGGTYSGTGVTSSTVGGATTWSFDPALAGPGTHEITYHYANYAGCMDSSTISVFNFQLWRFPHRHPG